MHWPLLRVKVAERSMEPALRPGDWLLVRRTRRIRAGQIVLARHPGRPDMLIVKRAARRVDGGWWLESDNPDAGAVDSRRFGAVPAPSSRAGSWPATGAPRPGRTSSSSAPPAASTAAGGWNPTIQRSAPWTAAASGPSR